MYFIDRLFIAWKVNKIIKFIQFRLPKYVDFCYLFENGSYMCTHSTNASFYIQKVGKFTYGSDIKHSGIINAEIHTSNCRGVSRSRIFKSYWKNEPLFATYLTLSKFYLTCIVQYLGCYTRVELMEELNQSSKDFWRFWNNPLKRKVK